MDWSDAKLVLRNAWNSLRKKFTRKTFYWFIGGFCVLVIAAYLLAPTIIRYAISKKIAQIETEKQIKVEVNGLQLDGISGVNIESIYVIPLPNDTLLSVRKLQASLSFWQMLLFRPDLKSVSIESIDCRFVKKEEYCNYNFLFKSKPEKNQPTSNSVDFSKRISSILNLLFRLLPSDLTIDNLRISSLNNELSTVISSQAIKVADHTIAAQLRIEDNQQKQVWNIEGVLDKENRKLVGKIASDNAEKATFPYIYQIYQTKISFNELAFNLQFEEDGSVVNLNGRASFRGLELNHNRLSPEDIQLGEGAMDYRLHIGSDFAELDSTSEVSLNRIAFHPYLYLRKTDKWHLIAQVDKSNFPAADLFASLPRGLFHSLDNIQVRGNLNYHFLLDVDLNNPDSLRLESALKKSGFAISSYGELTKMNAPFQYTAYESDRPVRTFEVGVGNPNFRPLESVSMLLRQSVLQSEDGQFYFHRGFRLDALREALIHDIKVKRFARGGSTISMQLVKNVFLNRHKNIARKLEEALLVWLIEENHITSKDRMFEVYLNIAEWGPMVYGIGEASRFYFDKEPADLTLNEAIFLASIIPSPKRFASSFDASGQLKANRFWHFNSIAQRLFRTGYITEEERTAFAPSVVLTGEAKAKITVLPDSIPNTVDSEVAIP